MTGFKTLRLNGIAQLRGIALTALSLPYLGNHMKTDSIWLPTILYNPAQNCSYGFTKHPTSWTVKGQYFALCFYSFWLAHANVVIVAIPGEKGPGLLPEDLILERTNISCCRKAREKPD